MSLTTLYLITVLPNIGESLRIISALIGILSIAVSLITMIVGLGENSNELKSISKKSFKCAVIPALLASFISNFIPSEKQMNILLGGYIAYLEKVESGVGEGKK